MKPHLLNVEQWQNIENKSNYARTLNKNGKGNEMPKKHYLEENGSRWYVKVNSLSDEAELYFQPLDVLYKFPYYVVFDEDIGVVETYPTLNELKQDESD